MCRIGEPASADFPDQTRFASHSCLRSTCLLPAKRGSCFLAYEVRFSSALSRVAARSSDRSLSRLSSLWRAMPPKKKPVQGVARPPLPQPNQAHPCASLLPSALAPSTFTDRPHSPAYHCFITSPYYPSTSRTTDEPPKKRSKASSSVPKLPAALDTAIDAVVLQQKLLSWFDGVKEKRGMPWRKDLDPNTLSRKEKNRRGYEVKLRLPTLRDSPECLSNLSPNRSGSAKSCCNRQPSQLSFHTGPNGWPSFQQSKRSQTETWKR